ncbi:MAG TPA: hypothetical protein VM681_10440 [Candidatus Thermoplasmatota archaeon]|nr:hypothetical protein [Candidatus Thermoplasmatota archaeon]
MRRLLRASTLALAIAPLLLAGCLGSAAAGTAQANLPPAESRAKEWHSGATLYMIVGAEGTWIGAFAGGGGFGLSSGERSRVQSDGTVGDGRTEVWVYVFKAAGKSKAFVVVTDKDGKVLRAEETDASDTNELLPVGEWKINSDEALRRAKDANEGLRRGVESSNFGIAEILRREQGETRAQWHIAGGGGDASGGGGGYVKLDAVTGQVLESQGGYGSASGFGGWTGYP